MKKLLKLGLIILAVIVILIASFYLYFFTGKQSVKDGIIWGVDFSQSHAEYLKLDWKKMYLAMIDDLGAKNIKIHTNWSWIEGRKGDFYFKDTDWQIKKAEEKNVKVIYVLGMKTGRWPECHTPNWAKYMTKDQAQAELLKYVKEVVLRYKNSKAISYWQVENEPLFKFGECPYWYYQSNELLKAEVALVKSLDPSREVIISDSGELSTWLGAANIGDIVGITMYRSSWSPNVSTFGINPYSFLNPETYAKKAGIINSMFGKKVICIELQAEPWASLPLRDAPLEEQLKSMNPDLLKENVEFAKKTGLDTFYFWGVEWWYWMKEKQNQPEIWNQAKQIFTN
jgi:hypothetical protein